MPPVDPILVVIEDEPGMLALVDRAVQSAGFRTIMHTSAREALDCLPSEPADVALPKKSDVDQAYLQLAEKLLTEAGRQRAKPVFGTHDVGLIERIRKTAVDKRLDPSSYELHMLYGIRAEEQRRLASMGVQVRVLISYGSAWFAWYMRRLAERPANVWFVLRNVV